MVIFLYCALNMEDVTEKNKKQKGKSNKPVSHRVSFVNGMHLINPYRCSNFSGSLISDVLKDENKKKEGEF